MNFFSGLEWVNGAHMPRCTAWVDKIFPDYCCLNYAHRGQLQWRIGRARFITLKAPVAWWTFPGPHFQYGVKNRVPWDHYFVCFRGPRMEAFRKKGLLPVATPRPWATIADPARFVRTFETVIGPPAGPETSDRWRVHELEGLLLQLSEPPGAPPKSDQERRLRELVERIRAEPGAEWDLAAEARRLAYSVPHFHRLFRQQTGLPPHRFLLRTRIEAAARLLHDDAMPLKSVAEAVRCPDIYYFSRLFRQRFGVPPGRYRRQGGLP